MNPTKLVIGSLLTFALVTGARPFAPAVASAQTPATFEFKLADDSNPGETLSDVGQWFADEVTKQSRGRITIKHFTSSTLGGGSSVVQGARGGWIDISAEGMSYYISILPELGAFTVPYMFSNPDQARRAANSAAGQAMLADLKSKGLVALGIGTNGWIDILTRNKAIQTPADFKGLRLRTLPSAVDVATMKALGAEAVNLETSQVYVSLQQGLVDGAEVTLHLTAGAKLYEVTKNYNMTHQSWLPFVMAMNLDQFNKLPPDLQKLMTRIATEAVARSWPEEEKEDSGYQQKLKADGLLFSTYSPADIAAFRAVTEPLYPTFGVSIGQDNLNAIMKTR